VATPAVGTEHDRSDFAVVASEGDDVRLFDADSGRELTRLGVHSSVSAVAFSPDGEDACADRRVGTQHKELFRWQSATCSRVR
jgi:hypothetical protein